MIDHLSKLELICAACLFISLVILMVIPPVAHEIIPIEIEAPPKLLIHPSRLAPEPSQGPLTLFRRDNTTQRAPDPEAVPEIIPTFADYEIEGIVITMSERFIIVNSEQFHNPHSTNDNRFFREGELIDDWLIKQINFSSVVVEQNGHEHTIQFHRNIPLQPKRNRR